MNYICWFEEIGLTELDQVGGKGANLGELTRAGLPVPPGFCITSTAYQSFLTSSGLDSLIDECLAEINLADRADLEARSARIRLALQEEPVPGPIADQIAVGYEKLVEKVGGQRGGSDLSLAVRSSATAEDQANASFAGQLETYLNVRGITALLEHIRTCWASLWSERALTYIAKQGLNHRAVTMSVVVQSMIPSEVAGVLFTANPVTGSKDEMVINASWGLGEAIVSGVVSPDTITARKIDGKVVDRLTSTKETMVAYAPSGGTEELPVPEHLRTVPALNDKQVIELVALGNKIEAYYGKPQDIEWGYYRGSWYLLQSRPITTLAQTLQGPYPPGDFNRTMFIEIFPEPLSPIFLSIVEPLFKNMLDYTFQSLGFETPSGLQAVGGFYNQPYFNQEYIAAALEDLSPPVRDPLIDQIVNPFGKHDETTSLELSVPFLRMAADILRFMVRFPKQLPGLLASYQAEIARASVFSYETATEVESCNLVRRLTFEHASKLLDNDFLMIAVIGRTYRLLGMLLKRYYMADTDEVVAKLISGVTGNVTMETNKRLWDLAQIARSSPTICEVLRENDTRTARILLQRYPDGKGFLQAVDRFLSEYGHREVHMDILYPTWCDDPEPVYNFIRSYLDADETQSPHRQQQRLIQERQQLTSMVMKDLEKGVIGRLVTAPLFRWVLRQTQVHTRERDTMHFEMTRLFPPMREVLLDLGSRWTAFGLLDREEDIFFLRFEEIEAVAREHTAMQTVVQARRQEFEHFQGHACPIIIRDGQEIYAESATSAEASEGDDRQCLHGVAGSPGRVEGIARVILGPEQFSQLKKGEILVAPITNPAWTPLFAVAGGIVTEVGGILSHGAIVAREYGIPAVMSVRGATRLFQDGQRVLVDGNQGLVILEGEA